MKILIIDNYDSFTYNLYQYLGEALESRKGQSNAELKVIRNDEWRVEDIQNYAPDRIVIGPGPGSPEDPDYFGVSMQCIRTIGRLTPILGVCLGMQGIAAAFGGKVQKAELPMHGKLSHIAHSGRGIFANIPQGVETMRYHSLVVEQEGLPDCLDITALSLDSTFDSSFDNSHAEIWSSQHFSQLVNNPQVETELMGIRHRDFPLTGIQFHPESFGSEGGKDMLSNFIFESH